MQLSPLARLWDNALVVDSVPLIGQHPFLVIEKTQSKSWSFKAKNPFWLVLTGTVQ